MCFQLHVNAPSGNVEDMCCIIFHFFMECFFNRQMAVRNAVKERWAPILSSDSEPACHKLLSLRTRTHGQKGTQICDPLANKCP